MKDEDIQRCEAMVQDRFHYSRCFNKAKVERDGKHYCKVHDPVSLAEKRKARTEKWDAENKRQHAQWQEQDARRKAIANLCGEIPTAELANYELVKKP